MARGFMYVYERIIKEQRIMQKEFEKIPINGRQTSRADQKRVRQIISDSNYQVAQECKVMVGYPRMRIAGKRVELGEASIMLPNMRIVNLEQLRQIEEGG